ncbi:hypothetical protein RRG08_029256 [Elysia crispata]|uniref:Uncharacterized protein n=1 Tax=Elysia crispata TaxID=231223 RepID=A0AAE1AIZ8_9GAST|nr:hypothetical protein RRG08_029256 [Elysia crispata]
MLQYRNTPDRDTKLSPAMCIFGHPIRDFIPIPPGNYRPHRTWRETLEARESALRNRHMQNWERWSERTKRLPSLTVGDYVRIQNQIGPYPLKWGKTGRVIENTEEGKKAFEKSGQLGSKQNTETQRFWSGIPNEEESPGQSQDLSLAADQDDQADDERDTSKSSAK